MIHIYLMMLDNEQDKNKFTLIYEKYKRMIFYTALRIVKNHHLAEEIMQDSFLKIVKNIHSISDVNSKETRNYIITITRNTALDVAIKNKTCETFEETWVNNNEQLITQDILDFVVSQEGYNKLISIIEKLDDTYRETLKLKVRYEYSNDEIAKIQGITKRAAEMRIYRGRMIIKELLGRERDNNADK